MRKIIYLILALIVGSTFAQKITFDKLTYDFGKFKEELGPQTYTFKFKNIGTKTLVLNKVDASCGCTTPEYTHAPIAPGKSGDIKVTFDPKNRPGPFNKTVTVRSNAENSVVVLKINGVVLEREKTLTDLYPQSIGDLSVKSTNFNFSSIKNTEKKTASLPVYNGSSKDLKVEFVDVPSYITLKLVPSVIKPGAKAKILGVYDGTKVNDYGFILKRVKLKINGKIVTVNKLSVSAKITEDFSKLTPQQLANAPKLSFNSKLFDFGTIKEGQSKTYEFVLTNNGKTDLIIRKIKSSCGCTVVKPETKIIKSGESTKLVTTFNSAGKSGRQRKKVIITTNDPKNSTVNLNVIGVVQ